MILSDEQIRELTLRIYNALKGRGIDKASGDIEKTIREYLQEVSNAEGSGGDHE